MAPLETRDPRLHDLVAPDAPIDRIAGGLTFTEGPVWRGGALLFSDIPNKRIVRWRRLPEGPELTTYATGMSNGLAFSPDESVLYIDDSAHKHIRALDVRPDGTQTGSRILLDMASPDPGVPDGLKVDVHGNVFCTGPGGVWVCRADGTLLGRIVLPELPANLAWGENGTVLFFTARTSVYRMPTKTRGTILG